MGLMVVSAGAGLVPFIGFLLYFLAGVVGQLGAGLLVDGTGFLGSPRKGFSICKLLLLILATLGVCLSVFERLAAGVLEQYLHIPDIDLQLLGQSITISGSAGTAAVNGTAAGAGTAAGGFSSYPMWVVGLCSLGSLLASSAMPIQTAINRQVSEGVLHTKLQTAFFSFTMGTLASAVAVSITLLASKPLHDGLGRAFLTSSWWMYCTGPMGVFYIASGIWFVGKVGSAAFFLLLISGQVAGAALLDSVGFLGNPKQDITLLRLVGLLVVVLCALLIRVDCACCYQRSACKGCCNKAGGNGQGEGCCRRAFSCSCCRRQKPSPQEHRQQVQVELAKNAYYEE